MATKQFYATGDFKYGTRMMRAGDQVEMDGPTARLYRALGRISPTKPRKAEAPAAEQPLESAVRATAKPRKRAAKKK